MTEDMRATTQEPTARTREGVNVLEPDVQTQIYLTAVNTQDWPIPTAATSVDREYWSATNSVSNRVPLKQLSVKKIKGQIGRRLDGEQQLLNRMLKSIC